MPRVAKGPKKRPKLLSAEPNGFTETQAIFFFHVTRLSLRRNWSGVAIHELTNASGNLDGNPNNRLLPSMLGRRSTELQWLMWDNEPLPYLVHRNTWDGEPGVGIAYDVCVALPHTARVIMEMPTFDDSILDRAHEGYLHRGRFMDMLRTASHLRMQTVGIDNDFEFLIRHQYICMFSDAPDEQYFRQTDRVNKEIKYIRRLAEIYVPGQVIMPVSSVSGRKRLDGGPFEKPRLSVTQAAVLMAVWVNEGWKTQRHNPPEEERPITTFQQIKEALRTRGIDYSEEEIKNLVKEIDRYQGAYDWRPIIQYDHKVEERRTGIKFVRDSPVTFPESAALIIDIARYTNQEEAFDAAEQNYGEFGRDMKFFIASKYVRETGLTSPRWEISERVNAEELYLDQVARVHRDFGARFRGKRYFPPVADPN